MVALIIHFVIAVAVIAVIVASNPQIFRRPVTGPKVSVLEAVYYLAGIAATVIGYYFNFKYVNEYSQGTHNAIWGDHGSWKEFMQLGFANPAVASANSDYYMMALVVLLLFLIVDGRRRGIRHSWLYNLFSLTASCTFAFGFYLATVERQRRVIAASPSEPASLHT